MKKTTDTINENTNDNPNLLNFFDTVYLQNLNLTNTLPNDESNTKSQDNDGESSGLKASIPVMMNHLEIMESLMTLPIYPMKTIQ